MYEKKPWLKYYKDVPHSLDYPKVTMYEALMSTVQRKPNAIAWDFMGYTATYKEFAQLIDMCAEGLYALGLREGDTITISMPTTPQGIICFYAVNKIGAVASMIHPLSPPKEIEFYLNISNSKFALTIDAFYGAFKKIIDNTPCKTLLLTKISDFLPELKALGFYLTKGRKIPKVPKDPRVVWWTDMMKQSSVVPKSSMKTDTMAVILYSGGTTGMPKGIMLSNMNFISEGMQVAAWGKMSEDDTILAILPIFHGFGLGVCVNAFFMGGGKSILVPQFDPVIVAKLIKQKKPNFLIGVPTLFEALSKSKVFGSSDLSCIKAAFSGADTLPRAVKEEFEKVVARQGGNVKLREGYGLTEAVTAIMAMPMNEYREGSIGIPFPDMMAKIVKQGTTEEAECGQEGEICIAGPAVMLGYLNQPGETAKTLRKHDDGIVWLHTGDIGTMDEDGFFYFKLRLKRMIKSSGFNVYPSQVEDILRKHPAVYQACVIGVPDKAQVERVKAFIVLKPEYKDNAGDELAEELIGHCREHLIKWSCPRDIEFRDELPKTKVGKIAFNVLEEEEKEKLRSRGEYAG
ncbi:MAG: AMP-binding protein [Spirochaetota bacterium]